MVEVHFETLNCFELHYAFSPFLRSSQLLPILFKCETSSIERFIPVGNISLLCREGAAFLNISATETWSSMRPYLSHQGVSLKLYLLQNERLSSLRNTSNDRPQYPRVFIVFIVFQFSTVLDSKTLRWRFNIELCPYRLCKLFQLFEYWDNRASIQNLKPFICQNSFSNTTQV